VREVNLATSKVSLPSVQEFIDDNGHPRAVLTLDFRMTEDERIELASGSEDGLILINEIQ